MFFKCGGFEMKIIENSSFINAHAYAKNVDEKKTVDSFENNDSNGALKEDRVELSSAAKKILEAKKTVDSLPDIRKQKIADIKMQIENRTYQFNEKKMASGLLKESLLNDLL
jgi:negative regulator of flagellin synthesis FlgM